MTTRSGAFWPGSIREINDLAQDRKYAIYRTLIPNWVYPMFEIDPDTVIFQAGTEIVIRCPSGSASVEITVYHEPESKDPALYLHMGDTFNSQLVVMMVVVNDPNSPRFNVDVDAHGQTTQLGTCGRNISEELRAMQAGLAPGQVRRGLRVFRSALPTFEQFVSAMGHQLFLIEPLFYHNAIAFERYGFTYARGFQKMKTIQDAFSTGGRALAALDGSTPFRSPELHRSVRGRSWAIHDGVIGDTFSGVQMYKRVGVNANIVSFPNALW